MRIRTGRRARQVLPMWEVVQDGKANFHCTVPLPGGRVRWNPDREQYEVPGQQRPLPRQFTEDLQDSVTQWGLSGVRQATRRLQRGQISLPQWRDFVSNRAWLVLAMQLHFASGGADTELSGPDFSEADQTLTDEDVVLLHLAEQANSEYLSELIGDMRAGFFGPDYTANDFSAWVSLLFHEGILDYSPCHATAVFVANIYLEYGEAGFDEEGFSEVSAHHLEELRQAISELDSGGSCAEWQNN